MDLDDRLRLLEGCHDWQGLVDALEEAINGEQEPVARARLHLRLARVLAGPLMQGARALKHFQDAFKLDSSLTDALSEARAVYWQLGKLPMVRRLLELQIAERRNPRELVPHPRGKPAARGEVWARNGHLHRRRRAEVHDPADDIAGLE